VFTLGQLKETVAKISAEKPQHKTLGAHVSRR
jgi:hypothetical protein